MTYTKILKVSSRVSIQVLNTFLDTLRSELELTLADDEERISSVHEADGIEEENTDRIVIRLRSFDTFMIEITLRNRKFVSYEAAQTQVHDLVASSED